MTKFICTRWAFDLSLWKPTLPQLIVAVSSIQQEERDRLQRFHFIDDFLASLIGRLLMRKYIACQTDIKYEDIKLARDVRGKPYLLNENNKNPISFNVSHQGECVILAGVANTSGDNSDFGIGADVMKIEYSGGRPLKDFFRLMHSKFSENEWRFIQHPQHNSSDSLKAFMRNWCLKEAYVKELGVGITIDLQKISFDLNGSGATLEDSNLPLISTTLRVNDIPMNEWHFEEHLLKPQYCAAIACKNFKPTPSKFEFLNIEELLVSKTLSGDDDDNQVIVDYCKEALKKPSKKSN